MERIHLDESKQKQSMWHRQLGQLSPRLDSSAQRFFPEKISKRAQNAMGQLIVIFHFHVDLGVDATVELLIEEKHRQEDVLAIDQRLVEQIHLSDRFDGCN